MTVGAESFRDEGGRIRAGWATVLASTVGLIFGPSVLQYMTLGVFIPYLRAELGWSLSQIGLAATLLAIMTTIASSLQGLLVDRYGARRIILICLPLYGLGYAALALISGSIVQFYIHWALLPLLGIGLWPASWAKITSSWFERRLGFAIGVATTGIGIGAAIAPIAIRVVAEAYGWRFAFAAIGIASLLIAWPVAVAYLREGATYAAPASPAGSEQPAMKRSYAFWLLLAAFSLLGFYSISILVHLISILSGNGVPPRTAVAAQSALGAFMIVGRLVSGYIVDRVSIRIVVPAFAVIVSAALASVAAGATGPAAIAAAAAFGLLIGAEIDILGFVVKRYFGLRRYGAYYGVLFAAFQLGGAVGAIAIARWHEASGSYVGGLTSIAAACMGAGLLFALLGPYRFGHEPSLAAAVPLEDQTA